MKRSTGIFFLIALSCAFRCPSLSVSAQDVAALTEYTPAEHDFLMTAVGDSAVYEADASLPVSYDLRTEGFSTSVKNQKRTETCWAHAALASAESNMLKTGLADKVIQKNNLTGELDLSEAHLVWFGHCKASENPEDILYHQGGDSGTSGYTTQGTIIEAASALASGIGAELEKNMPDVTEKASIDESFRYHSYAHLENLEIFFSPNTSQDINNMKKSMMQHGALFGTIHSEESNTAYYSQANASYYYPSDAQFTVNHAITIIGWDDAYPASAFATAPPADGAWLCKNSYGETWGNDGYFWMSYYSAMSYTASFQMEEASKTDTVYHYFNTIKDSFGQNQTGTAVANLYTVPKKENLTEVSFWSTCVNANYTISVYKNINTDIKNPTAGTLISSQEFSAENAGYYTVSLPEPVLIEKNSTFSVIITSDTAGQKCFYYDLAPEGANYSYHSTYNASNASFGTWNISAYSGEPIAFYIKAFGSDGIIINQTNFSDKMVQAYAKKEDTDGNLVLSDSEIQNAVSFYWCPEKKNYKTVYSLDELEQFYNIQKITIQNAPLVALDLTAYENLKNFSCSGCGIYTDILSTEYLDSLGLDISKILKIQGAEIQDNQIIPNDKTITYTYDCGQGYTAEFTITGGELIQELVINETNFPDNSMYLYAQKIDKDGNGRLSASEIENAKYFSWKLEPKNYTTPHTLKGISHFTNLQKITIENASLIALDLSRNTALQSFTCTGCSLYLKEISPETVNALDIDISKILDIQGAKIQDSRIIPTSTTITYTYDCGQNYTAVFTITGETLLPDVSYSPGDVTGDNLINILDVITLNRAILGKESLDETQIKTIDFNQNGLPDSEESLQLLKYITGLIESL